MGKVFLIKIFSFGYLREVFKIILENINKPPDPLDRGRHDYHELLIFDFSMTMFFLIPPVKGARGFFTENVRE